jgi:MerR family transcriptional regulator, thiopeptide resistance regulator
MTSGLTICQKAGASVTVKIVRHYHRFGLVDEPRRDSSSYRRYGSSDLLRAGPGPHSGRGRHIAADLSDVKRRLTDRIEELVAPRDIPS